MNTMPKSDDSTAILGAISDLATMIDERFEQVDKRFEQVDKRFEQVDKRLDTIEGEIVKVHHEQAEMRQWMEQIDSRILGIESDIKEIYDRIVTLETKKTLTKGEQQELSRKFDALLAWARDVSRATGVALPKI